MADTSTTSSTISKTGEITPGEIHTRYQESFEFLQARKKRQAAQLVLLSNMRRGDQNIAATLMLTLFDRVMSSVYDDKIQVKFLPSQGILQEQINTYNLLAESDYQEMDKRQLDYDWCWDTLFFGRGYMETVRFDMDKKILQPHVINPLNFGYDPYVEEPQQWRYYWKWLTKSKNDLIKLQTAGVLEKDIVVNSLPSGIEPYLWDYKVKRDQARGGIAPSIQPVGADIYQILEYYGYENGEKYVCWLDKNFSKILYKKKLDFKDGGTIIMPDGKAVPTGSKWPIVVKEAFRVPHSSIPISIADLLEDKHRAKSVLLNLAFIAAKDTANPIYGYNPDKVKDVSQFMSRQISQHIPMDDESAAWPLNKASSMSPDLQAFIQYLDSEAQEPMGAGKPMSTPGSGGGKQTATQAALDQQLNDMAQSLLSKVMQFGEAEFWSQWFHRYARHAKELKEKTANIVGVKGIKSETVDLTMFKSAYPPGVMVYSAKEAEYKDLVKRRDYMQLYPNLQQTLDQDGMRNFNKHIFFPLFLQDPSLIDIMFPKTLDEIRAYDENEVMKDGTMPNVSDTDNHTTHLYIHQMMMPKNWSVWTHMAWHEEMLAQQQRQQMQAAMAQQQGQPQGQLQQGGPQQAQAGPPVQQAQSQQFGNQDKQNPLQAASPLKNEMANSNSANVINNQQQ